jgi:hypothetical protein
MSHRSRKMGSQSNKRIVVSSSLHLRVTSEILFNAARKMAHLSVSLSSVNGGEKM